MTLLEQLNRDATTTPSAARRPQILCVMRMPPNVNGHGGSQRAWYLLHALRALGDVHFVLVFRDIDQDCVETPLTHLESLVSSITRINIAGWRPHHTKKWGIVPGGVWDLLSMRSQEAPRLSDLELDKVAARLPVKNPDIIFAGRLCSAFIMQALIARKQLSAPLRVVDFDDIMSKFAMRQVRAPGGQVKLKKRLRMLIDSFVVAESESRIANAWHATSVCTDEDVAALREGHPERAIVKIPNVVLRERLAPRTPDGTFNILFAGNLGFAPNIDGLRLFVENGWPRLLKAIPRAQLQVVGLNPNPAVIELTKHHSLPLHANVPTLQPFYENCDAVIAPILFGSGTRIKILEAMAYGRPVVSTTVGAEGMGLVAGQHLLLADDMAVFADALITLANDPPLAASLSQRAYEMQQAAYTPGAIDKAVIRLFDAGRQRAALSAR